MPRRNKIKGIMQMTQKRAAAAAAIPSLEAHTPIALKQ
jgi:hypothetical protein